MVPASGLRYVQPMTRPDESSTRPLRLAARTAAALAAGIALAASLLVAAPAYASSPHYYPAGTVEVVDTFTSEDAAGTTITTTTTTLDGHGVILETDTVFDSPGGTANDSREVVEYTYDDSGLLVLRVVSQFSGGATTPDSTSYTEFEYDSKGEPTLIVDSDEGGITQSSTITRDKRTVTVVHTDAGGNETTTATGYTQRGRVLTESAVTVDAAGAPVSSQLTVNTYTSNGALLSTATTRDEGGELKASATTLEYGKQHLLVGYVTTTEPEGTTETAHIEYDDKGRGVLFTSTTVSATGEVIEQVTDQTFYDDKGVVTGGVSTMYDGDGNVTSEHVVEYEYDERGYPSRSQVTSSYGTTITEITNDKKGRALERVTEAFDPSGDLEYSSRDIHTFDKNGRLIGSVSMYDDNGDGVVDHTTTFTSVFR